MIENLDKYIVDEFPLRLVANIVSPMNNRHFLEHCVDKNTFTDYFKILVEFEERSESVRYKRYMYVKVEEENLKSYLNEKISFLDLLNLNEEVYLLTFIESWLQTFNYQIYKCSVKDLPIKYLPHELSFSAHRTEKDWEYKYIINFKEKIKNSFPK